jgi:UDP-N-acetylmuramoylalanine--D-glutamate ligase
VTNIAPNHLDVHKDYQEYIDAKKNIFLYQSFLGRLVLNHSNYVTRQFADEARGEVVWFQEKTAGGYYYDDTAVYFPDEQSIPRSEIALVGTHNVENYCCAIAAVRDFVSVESIRKVVRSFKGVEHRIEFIREIGGVAFYNSSIDSSPNRTKATLKAFQEAHRRVVIIAGGKDKNSDYAGLGDAMIKAGSKIILCGQNSSLIRESIEKATRNADRQNEIIIYETATYEEAVNRSLEIAEIGDSVVLTPAGTSFDQFRNFEERGNKFKDLVNAL